MTKKYLPRTHVDFLQPEKNSENYTPLNTTPSTPRRPFHKRLVLMLSLVTFVISSALYIQASASPLSKGMASLPLIGSLGAIITGDTPPAPAPENDIINVVIIGMGGEGHDGGYLADTIILGRFHTKEKQVALVSIPRDFAANIPGYGWHKINNAHAYGGPELLRSVLSEIINDSIPYYITVDFNGFQQIIDELGGIDVYVDRSFTDYSYPDGPTSTQVVSFTQGQQHMDGDTALKYARSRQSPDNNEGSDFARAARQQKILFAVKDKVLSFNTLLNPSKLMGLYDSVTKHLSTNISPTEMLKLAQLGQGIRQTDIHKLVLTDGPNGPLVSTIADSGAYLLIPKIGFGNFSQIRKQIDDLFVIEPDEATEKTTTVAPRQPHTIVLNGTTIPGYANTVASLLSDDDFAVELAANHLDQSLDHSIVYVLDATTDETQFETLQDKLTFDTQRELPTELADYLQLIAPNITLTDLTYIVVLGTDNQAIMR